MSIHISAPTEIADCAFWCRSDQGITLDVAAKVQQWNDLSGNGRHLTQNIAGKKPLMGVGPMSGSLCVVGDGVDDFMETATYARTSAETVFLLAKFPGTTNKDLFCDKVADYHRAFVLAGNLTADNSGGGGGTLNFGSATTLGAAFRIYTFVFNSSSSLGRVNSSKVTSGDTGNTVQQVGFNLGIYADGFSNPMAISVAEMIRYNRALQAGEIAIVERYLSRSWSISPSRVAASGRVAVSSRVAISGRVPDAGVDPSLISGRSLHCRADQVTLVSGAASSWTDISGSGHPLLQNTPAARPTVVAGPNAKPALLLDGVDDLMRASFSNIPPTTVFMVYAHPVAFVGGYDFDGTVNFGMNLAPLPNGLRMNQGTNLDATIPPELCAINKYIVLCARFTHPSSLLRVNGTTYAAGPTGAGAPLGFTLGAAGNQTTCSHLLVAEVIIYGGRILSLSEMISVERYLGNSYKIFVG